VQHLARRVLVAAHPQPEAVDAALVAPQQLVDGGRVTGARLLQQ
jgi:hypothetical protein